METGRFGKGQLSREVSCSCPVVLLLLFFLKFCSAGSKLWCEPALGARVVHPDGVRTQITFLRSRLAPPEDFTDLYVYISFIYFNDYTKRGTLNQKMQVSDHGHGFRST